MIVELNEENKKLFVPCKVAIALKEIGFDTRCFARYLTDDSNRSRTTVKKLCMMLTCIMWIT